MPQLSHHGNRPEGRLPSDPLTALHPRVADTIIRQPTELRTEMTQCARCGSRMSVNDETTKLTEYVCPRCHNTEIVQKESFRVTA